MKNRGNRFRGGFFKNSCCENSLTQEASGLNNHCHMHRNRSKHNIKILSDMPTGFTGTINNIAHNKREILQKILALGLTIGSQIKVKSNATSCCGSVVVEVKNSKVVLCNSIAQAIVVS
ncbi:FeoA family protein [Lentisphaerota bacterium WC36G]|nr:ferrous iron transport protein A [Lentisphaerae bacterium WC36]